MRVRAYLGLGSRYSYLASTQLDRIAKSCGADFEWIPINSVELIRRARPDGSPFENPILAGQYRPAFRTEDAVRWAAHYGVAFQEPRISSLPPGALALACWCQSDPELRRELIVAIYNAVFADGIELDMSVLETIAGCFGVGGAEFAEALHGGPACLLHEQAIGDALGDGAFGVPSFFVDGALFWGNDRLTLLEDYLRRASNEL